MAQFLKERKLKSIVNNLKEPMTIEELLEFIKEFEYRHVDKRIVNIFKEYILVPDATSRVVGIKYDVCGQSVIDTTNRMLKFTKEYLNGGYKDYDKVYSFGDSLTLQCGVGHKGLFSPFIQQALINKGFKTLQDVKDYYIRFGNLDNIYGLRGSRKVEVINVITKLKC